MRYQDNTTLPCIFTAELLERYEALVEACLQVKEAVSRDAENYPVYVPQFSPHEVHRGSMLARDAAIKSMTQLFYSRPADARIEAGILCASDETVSTVEKLNDAKESFKSAVTAIREYEKSKDITARRINALINERLKAQGYRTEAVRDALGTAGLVSLDLKRCYAKIRILPPNVTVFGWTWITNHARIQKLNLLDAEQLVEAIPSNRHEIIEVARRELARCKPGETLVRKIPLTAQLRANYAYLENGELVRKACPISGIVVAQQRDMPRKVWREAPDLNDARMQRMPRMSKIAAQPAIKALGIYRYAQ